MVLYLQLETDLLRRRGRVLHIAPEAGVHAFLSAFSLVDNVTLDVDAWPDVQVQADARDLPFEDRSFDAVLCSHVLERIPEDVDVAREMARVLVKDWHAHTRQHRPQRRARARCVGQRRPERGRLCREGGQSVPRQPDGRAAP